MYIYFDSFTESHEMFIRTLLVLIYFLLLTESLGVSDEDGPDCADAELYSEASSVLTGSHLGSKYSRSNSRISSWVTSLLTQMYKHFTVLVSCSSMSRLKFANWSAGGRLRIVGKQRERNTVWRREAHSRMSPSWTHLLKSSPLLIRWEVSWGHNRNTKTCNTNINLNIYTCKLQL